MTRPEDDNFITMGVRVEAIRIAVEALEEAGDPCLEDELNTIRSRLAALEERLHDKARSEGGIAS